MFLVFDNQFQKFIDWFFLERYSSSILSSFLNPPRIVRPEVLNHSWCPQYHPLIKRPKYQHFIAFSFLWRQILWDNPFNPTWTRQFTYSNWNFEWYIGNYVLLWLYRLNCEAKQITLQRKSVRFLKEVEDIFVVSGKSSVNFVLMVSNHKILFFVRHCFSR